MDEESADNPEIGEEESHGCEFGASARERERDIEGGV